MLLIALLCTVSGYAQEGNPRHPAVVHFEEIGRLAFGPGTLWPLGDISRDGIDDFATEHYLDTCLSPSRCAQELRIHYGVKNALPKPDEGFRLSPRELMSKSIILCSGDWDNRNGDDLCIRYEFFTDTSFGRRPESYVFHTAIFWNNGQGEYSWDDTTQLWPGAYGSFGPTAAVAIDLNNDHVEDLFISTIGSSYQEGELKRNFPRGYIYYGHAESGVENSGYPDIQWWGAPQIVDRLEAQDLDHNGGEDLIFYLHDANAPLTVLYGRTDFNLPDTISDLEQIHINGLNVSFSDVTGDRYPDLVILNSAVDEVYCYVSTPSARRLQEMFGTGNDPPREGEWWSRPWATLKGPHLVNEFWPQLSPWLFPLGSADTSGPEEIWIQAWPYILVYRTGMRLDSIFDAEIDLRVAGGTPVRIGDIDGNGRDELAMVAAETTIFRLSDELPSTVGRIRRVPDGTDVPDTISGVEEQEGEEDNLLGLAVHPNPSSGEVVVEWRSRESGVESRKVVLRITDILGQEVLSTEVPVQQDRYVWDASKTFGGRYFISVTINGVSQTTQVSIQQ